MQTLTQRQTTVGKAPVIFQLAKRNVNSSYEGRYFPPSTNIPNEDVVFDPIKGEDRMIRFVVGETSIYVDEQREYEAKQLENALRASQILFDRGTLTVDPRERLLLSYLRATNYNATNPNRKDYKRVIFKEVVAGVEEKVSNEKLFNEAEAIVSINKMPFGELVTYAKVLGVDTNKETEEIKHNMIVIAKRNPTQFLNGMNDRNMKRKYHILNAVDNQIIEVNKLQNSVSWFNGMVIHQARLGEDVVDSFVAFTFAGKEGIMIYDEIKRLLSQKGVKVGEEAKSEPKQEVIAPVKNEFQDSPTPKIDSYRKDFATMLKDLNEKGLCEKSGSWFKFNFEYNGATYKVQGANMFKIDLSNAELANIIEQLL